MINLVDRLSFDAANMRLTKSGYLAAAPRVARIGVQLYKGSELGGEFADRDVVRVYRPEAEVFHSDAMASLAHQPLTNDHPPVEVTAENWKEYAVGQTDGDVLRDGTFVRVPMLFMDRKAIQDIRRGKKQLSVGYSCELKIGDGVTPDGEKYDAIQTKIRANHIALVKAARGGSRLSVGDELEVIEDVNQGDEDTMNDKTTLRSFTVDGISVDMTDTAIQVVQKALGESAKRLEDATAKHKTAVETSDKTIADLTASVAALTKDKDGLVAENAALKKQVEDAKLTPAKLDEMVKDRQITMGKAAAILGDKLLVEGKTDAEIRRQVVDAQLGEVSKTFSDDQVSTAFLTLTKDVKPLETGSHAVQDARAAFRSSAPNDPKEKAYADYNKRMADAWKGPAANA